MGFFNRLFKTGNDSRTREITAFPWNILNLAEQLEEMEKESEKRAVVIFKYSTRCGISRMVLKRFEAEYDYSAEMVKPYFLDLLKHRDLSQEIASRFGVVHESPQILVLKQGETVHHASHQGISATKLRDLF